MENPAREIKHVIRALTLGSADEQHDAIYRYFAPGATFEHPFCRVPSFKNLYVPGLGVLDSRFLIEAIFRWYKILSPRISLEIESCVQDERENLIFVRAFQIFSIWFIPFHRAPVRLVSVLHLAPSPPINGTAPPPYDAAQEKLQAVQEGAEPSYAAVASGEASTLASGSQQEEGQGAKSRRSSRAGSESSSRPTRYLITKQQDLYQVNEFLKFVTLCPGSAVAGCLQVFATLLCLVGTVLLGPLMRVIWPAESGKGKRR